MFKIRKSSAATLAAATAILAVGSAGGAVAGSLITGSQIAGGTITSRNMAGSSIYNFALAKKAIAPDNLSSALQAEVGRTGAPGQNAFVGTQTFHNTSSPSGDAITNIGGSFATRASTVGTFHLDAGTYLINSSADFERTDLTDRSTPALQLAIRGDDGSQWGADYGTCFTGAFPASSTANEGNLDQDCSASQLVTVPSGGITVDIKAFGYNADTSADGSGKFQVWANVNVLQINTN